MTIFCRTLLSTTTDDDDKNQAHTDTRNGCVQQEREIERDTKQNKSNDKIYADKLYACDEEKLYSVPSRIIFLCLSVVVFCWRMLSSDFFFIFSARCVCCFRNPWNRVVNVKQKPFRLRFYDLTSWVEYICTLNVSGTVWNSISVCSWLAIANKKPHQMRQFQFQRKKFFYFLVQRAYVTTAAHNKRIELKYTKCEHLLVDKLCSPIMRQLQNCYFPFVDQF